MLFPTLSAAILMCVSLVQVPALYGMDTRMLTKIIRDKVDSFLQKLSFFAGLIIMWKGLLVSDVFAFRISDLGEIFMNFLSHNFHRMVQKTKHQQQQQNIKAGFSNSNNHHCAE